MRGSIESAANRHRRFLAVENNNNNNRRQHLLIVIFYVLLGLFLAHLILMSVVWVHYKPFPFHSSTPLTTSDVDTVKHHHRNFDETASRFRLLTNNNNINAIQKHKPPSKTKDDDDDDDDWRYHPSIFNHIYQRAISSKKSCQSSSSSPSKQQQQDQINSPRNITTNNEPQAKTAISSKQQQQSFPHLPEYGIINAISSWNKAQNSSHTLKSHHHHPPYPHNNQPPQCLLPPGTSCNETKWTVVFLSHSSSPHIFDLKSYITEVFEWEETSSIILVWNSPRDSLIDEELRGWHDSPAHKLDIFFVLDYEQQESSLFNRYHPALLHLATTNALLYFDDDGPVFRLNALKRGFELWKRNSGVPVGCFVRGVSYSNNDDRSLDEMMRRERDMSERQVLEGWQSVSPYNDLRTNNRRRKTRRQHPQFIPTCPIQQQQQPNLIYDYNHVTPYGAQISLPSGTFLHVNFLCFLWHPLFDDIRRYVLHHPAHADDIAVSVIISQITGKSLRTYPMRLKSREDEIGEAIENERRVWEQERVEEERQSADKKEESVMRNERLMKIEEDLIKRERRVKRREDDVAKKWEV